MRRKYDNPLDKLRQVQRMTCYNGYICSMKEKWRTKQSFTEYCLSHEVCRGATVRRMRMIAKLAGEAWDWWFQV